MFIIKAQECCPILVLCTLKMLLYELMLKVKTVLLHFFLRCKLNILVLNEPAELRLNWSRMKRDDFVGTLKLVEKNGGTESHVESQLSFFAVETSSSEVLGEIAVSEVGKVHRSGDWGKGAILVVGQKDGVTS